MDAQILGAIYTLISGLLGVLILLIKTMMGKIDKLTDSINVLNLDVNDKLSAQDKRITWVEVFIDRIKDN